METVRNTSSGKKVKYAVKKRPESSIETSLLSNPEYQRLKAILPVNYNFEIEKTISKIKNENSNVVGLQFPEGLLMYACVIVDIIQRFTHPNMKVFILGDVTYGACCVDDFTCNKLGIDLLIHYGHSCLVPLQYTKVKVMYVFVEIQFDPNHLIQAIHSNFDKSKKLAILGTIQFVSNVFAISNTLKSEQYDVMIPQCKPLSPAETLGCTSPILPSDIQSAIFIADGRFHLESAMIQNPSVSFYRYDPYSKILSAEGYDIELMKSVRMNSIVNARKATTFGLILGTLGRQGNMHIFNRLKNLAMKHGKVVVPFLMAEINLQKLQLIEGIDAWVQVSCPRLSIDWGGGFTKPLLTPYEFEVTLRESEWQEVYPMDYYRHDAGTWANYSTNNKLSS